MSAPTTEAGKAHLEDWIALLADAWGSGSVNRESMEATVAAIEAEAVKNALGRITEAMDAGDADGDAPPGQHWLYTRGFDDCLDVLKALVRTTK